MISTAAILLNPNLTLDEARELIVIQRDLNREVIEHYERALAGITDDKVRADFVASMLPMLVQMGMLP